MGETMPVVSESWAGDWDNTGNTSSEDSWVGAQNCNRQVGAWLGTWVAGTATIFSGLSKLPILVLSVQEEGKAETEVNPPKDD